MKGTISLSVCLAVALSISACSDQVNEQAKQKLTGSGFSEENARELSTMNLTEPEMAELEMARSSGLDGTAAVDMVKSLHERDLKFDLGDEMRLLMFDSLSSTAATQLVEMGAIPRWADDIRAMKQGGVSDVTVIEIEKMRVDGNEDLLSGGEYATLVKHGMSETGLLTFVRKKGTQQQLQQATLALDLGKSEQEALKEVGM